MTKGNFHDQQNIANIQKLRSLEASLPAFLKTFFRGIESTTETRTRVAYAVDLKVFFEFAYIGLPDKLKDPRKTYDICIENCQLMDDPKVLENFTSTDVEDFLDYIRYYQNDEGIEYTNSETGIKRKLSSIRAMYNYFHTHQLIDKNPTLQVKMPKIHEKNIIRMEPNEIASFLDTVESGENLTEKQLKFHEKTKVRDLAIMTLLLGTGIRVSECVGLDINDVDFDSDRINIIRKGGNESFVYFGEEIRKALTDYLEERMQITAEPGHENALFLSSRNTRMGARNIEILVRKYARISVGSKHITPHKLRSTYGTQLYTETGDIYLVADVLGHKDVNTTRKHYAAIEEERRRLAKNAVKLRENDET